MSRSALAAITVTLVLSLALLESVLGLADRNETPLRHTGAKPFIGLAGR